MKDLCWGACVVLGSAATLMLNIESGAPFFAAAFVILSLSGRMGRQIPQHRPGGERSMKIHLVTTDRDSTRYLVKAHTRAGAEKFVAAKFKPTAHAVIPTQTELVDALQAGVAIEDATLTSPQEPSE